MEANVRAGTKVAENEFLVLTELLMVQLLQLDTIEADGEAKVQRRVEVSDYLVMLASLLDFVNILPCVGHEYAQILFYDFSTHKVRKFLLA